MRFPKDKKTMDVRARQVHQELGGTNRTFKELDDHARSS